MRPETARVITRVVHDSGGVVPHWDDGRVSRFPAQWLRDPRCHSDLRLEAGDLIAYDNNRALHGRAAFDARTGERHLQGCYLNAEDLASRLRLLDRA